MVDDEKKPGVGMPRARWDRERRAAPPDDSELSEAMWPWVSAVVLYIRRHWPIVLGLVFTMGAWLAINSYIVGQVSTRATIAVEQLAAISNKVETLQAIDARLTSLEIGYHELYPMVSKDLHEVIAQLSTLQEHMRGDNERFESLRAADTEIRQRLNMLQERQNALADRTSGKKEAR